MYSDRKPLCTDPDRDDEQDLASDRMEDDGTGGKVRVQRFRDGSSKYFGAMGCNACYNEFGEEC